VWVRQALVAAALPNIAHLAGRATDVCTAATAAARFSPTSVNGGAMAVTGDGAWYVYASLLRGAGAHAVPTLRTTSLATPVQLLLFSGASLSSCDGLSVLVLDGWVVCQPSLRLGTGLGAINQLRTGLDAALEQLAQHGAVRRDFLPPSRLSSLHGMARRLGGWARSPHRVPGFTVAVALRHAGLAPVSRWGCAGGCRCGGRVTRRPPTRS